VQCCGKLTAASCGGGSTGSGVPAPGMAYVPRHLAHKVKGVAGLLTEARV